MAIKQYKNVSSVPKKYRWDLDFLLEGKSPEDAMKSFLSDYKYEIKVKESKYNSKKDYLDYLKKSEKLSIKLNKFYNYLSNSRNENLIDAKANKLIKDFEYNLYKMQQEIGAEDVRFFAHSKELAKWAKLPEFKEYKHHIEGKLEEKKHQLPKAIQEFRLKEQRADISASEIFTILTDSETKFADAVSSKGKKYKVTHSNGMVLAKNPDAKVRKTASLSKRQGYLDHKNTLTSTVFQHFKHATVWSKLEKFDKTIDYLLFPDRVNEKMLLTLYQSVKDHMPLFRKKAAWHKKFYKAKYGKTMTKYDGAMDLVKPNFKELTVEDTKKVVLEAVKPFGKEYVDVTKKAFTENWVDFMPIDNKMTGAYSIGATFGIDKKLILMNFVGDIRSAETLAHELGHSMHSYFSDTYQKTNANSSYPIFLAEIASIFNELMLFDHLMKNMDDDKAKFHQLTQILEGFEGTVLRQIMWSNYEYDLYSAIENGESPSTYEALAKLYFNATKDYSIKKNPQYKEENQYGAIYVPHFFYDFYVYKYAIGQLVANIFMQMYKEQGQEALQNYINKFLKAGGHDWPLNILKDAGVDLNDPETYKKGFKSYENNLNQWIKLGKKVFKI